MIRDTGRIQLWADLGLADLLSPAAVGASFEGLANFLISGIAEPHSPPRSITQSDSLRGRKLRGSGQRITSIQR
jgi:hypothetical protein